MSFDRLYRNLIIENIGEDYCRNLGIVYKKPRCIRLKLDLSGDIIEKSFIMPSCKECSGYKLALFDVDKVEDAFKKDQDFYIDINKSLGNRYVRFLNFFKENDDIETSVMCINDRGIASFENGRHRFAVMRDLGMKVIPMVIDKRKKWLNLAKDYIIN